MIFFRKPGSTFRDHALADAERLRDGRGAEALRFHFTHPGRVYRGVVYPWFSPSVVCDAIALRASCRLLPPRHYRSDMTKAILLSWVS
jgi:hypothetical protein